MVLKLNQQVGRPKPPACPKMLPGAPCGACLLVRALAYIPTAPGSLTYSTLLVTL